MATKMTAHSKTILMVAQLPRRFGSGWVAPEYEIDLNEKNAKAFRKRLAPFIQHARKAGRGPRRTSGRASSSRQHSGAIRAWAKDQGIAVSARGRIPAAVVEQYEAATGGG